MKMSDTTNLTMGLAAIAGLAFTAISAHAAVTIDPAFSGSFTEVSSATDQAYDGDQSASDLIHELTATVATGWNLTNGSTVPELNDGIHGVSFAAAGNSAEGTWSDEGAIAEYDLGANVAGYDITSIQAIASWTDSGFGNQVWTVEVKPVGGSYALLATVDFTPFNNTGGATKVNLTGLDATGIESIKFTTGSTDGNSNGNDFVFREIDVVGAANGPDVVAPMINNLSPADEAGNAPVGNNLVVTFDEDITIGTGNITIKNLDAPSETAIPVGDAQISISGAVLTINPSSNLDPGTNYAVQIAATAITDATGNPFLGILDDTTWNFTTNAAVTIDAGFSGSFTAVSSATESAYEGDQSASDLLHGLTATVATDWTISNGASPSELNDGIHGGFPGGDAEGTWSNEGAIAEYYLGADVLGYDITSIQAIASWADSGFGNQVWTVEVKPVGGSYTLLATVDFTPFNHTGGATKVNLTGLDATGIEFIRFTAASTGGNSAGDDFVFREIDVVGAATPAVTIDAAFSGSFTAVSSATDQAYDGDQSASDLLHGLTATVATGWTISNGASPSELNDGIHGSFPEGDAEGTWSNEGAIAEYDLGANAAGYDITSIQAIASWSDSGFGNQVWTVEVKPVGGSYALLATVDFAPFNNAGGATKVNLTGLDATGIESIRFTAGSTGGNSAGDDFVFREIDVVGELSSDNFDSWISDPAFGLAVDDQDFADDPDGDQLGNGLEAWFGSHPGQFNAGLANISTAGNITTFTHPQNATVPDDLTGYYEWSPNLVDWYLSGNGPDGGSTVTFSTNTIGTTTTVTATASEGLDKIFLRAGVSQN